MSDSYHYEDGAIHHDHKKVLHIDKVQGADLQQLIRGFFHDDAEDAEYEEVAENDTLHPTPADTEKLPTETDNDGSGFVPDTTAIEKCFKFNSDFVKRIVGSLVADFYHGNYANLALIEITLFHHLQLKRRNSHKLFVMALAAWGIITIANDEEFKLIVMGVSDKYRRMPEEGYQEWDDNHKTDRLTCERMAKKLGPTIPYNR